MQEISTAQATEELAARLATLREQVQDLERQLDLMAPKVDDVHGPVPAAPMKQRMPETTSSRRRLLRNGAVAVGAGLAGAALGSQPASAANDDNLIIGQANSGTATTSIDSATASPAFQAQAIASGSSLAGVNFSTTGFSDGTSGATASPDGRGVIGENTSPTGPALGVLGITNSSEGNGVVGQANPTSGFTTGVFGSAQSADGRGVMGNNFATSGSGIGVLGVTNSPNGSAVVGECQVTTSGGQGTGVRGFTSAPEGTGVAGTASSTTGQTTGVFGYVSSPDGFGVFGRNYANSGDALGIIGTTNSPDGSAIHGRNFSSSGIGGWFVSGGAAIASEGRISVVPAGSAANTSPVAPIHVLQDGAVANVELLLQLESDVAPQQTFVNNSTGQKWFFAMTSDDEFKISRAGTGKVEAKFFGNGNMSLAGTLTQLSDENEKHDIVPVDSHEILDKVVGLPISTWKYDSDPDVTHMGPTAQDFAAAFNLGAGNTGIATVDADGVALAAIKALREENQDLARRQTTDRATIAMMRHELTELRARL